MAKNIVFHCGKFIPTQRELVIINYPKAGEVRYTYESSCKVCKHSAYAFYDVPFKSEPGALKFKSNPESLQQADKYTRKILDELVLNGRALLIEEASGDKNYRAKAHAGQYTLTTTRSPEMTYKYIKRILKGLPTLHEFIRNKRFRPVIRKL